MHTQTTSTPILSSNSRDLSYNTRHLSYERSRPEGVSTILQILIQTNHPILSSNSRDLSYNARKLSYERTYPGRVSPILKVPKILQILLQTISPTARPIFQTQCLAQLGLPRTNNQKPKNVPSPPTLIFSRFDRQSGFA